jgi:CubicO group peptidase (beta-lactamase class C family)
MALTALAVTSCSSTSPPTTSTNPTDSSTRKPTTSAPKPTPTSPTPPSSVPPTSPSTSPAANSAGVFEDPNGLYRVPVPTGWTATEKGGVAILADPDKQITVTLIVQQGNNAEAAINAAWNQVDPSFAGKVLDTQKLPAANGRDETVQLVYESAPDLVIVGGAERVGDKVFVSLVKGAADAVGKRQSQLGIIGSGFEILSIKKVDLSTAKSKAVAGPVATELERFIEKTIGDTDVPGALVGVVQNGKVVFAKAFGTKQLGSAEPINLDTQMMIGSTGKSLTTLMMGALVDDGVFTWDTPVQKILPSFTMSDPAVAKTVTMRQLVCACTGVPRRDLELTFSAEKLTGQQIVESLADYSFFTKPGEAFQYSNQMVAAGGYIAALATNPNAKDYLAQYEAELRRRVTGPIGMTDTTLSFKEVTTRNNYARPHGRNDDGRYSAVPIAVEEILTPVAPAGAHWSTLGDMNRYLMTQLDDGVAPSGARVVSAANLAEIRKPQVPVSASSQYGLGWFIDDYDGIQVINHGGNTLGFSSDFAFLPEHDLGIVVLTNSQDANLTVQSIRSRLLELVFDQPDETTKGISQALTETQKTRTESESRVQDVDAETAAKATGTYTNDRLGAVTISVAPGNTKTLEMKTPRFSTALKPIKGLDGIVRYVSITAPYAGLPFELDTKAASATLTLSLPPDSYLFTKQ